MMMPGLGWRRASLGLMRRAGGVEGRAGAARRGVAAVAAAGPQGGGAAGRRLGLGVLGAAAVAGPTYYWYAKGFGWDEEEEEEQLEFEFPRVEKKRHTAQASGLVGLYHRLKQLLLDCIRAIELGTIFLLPVASLPLWYIFPSDWWLKLLMSCMQLGGPTFTKLGQWASTRPDLFGNNVRDCLRVLHDQVRLEPWSSTKATLEMAFNGTKISDHFSEFSEHPIGAGCIAQVHKARIRSTGEVVAVKVQRERVRRLIERDLALLSRAVWCVEALLPRAYVENFGLQKTVDLFNHFMRDQMDFSLEAYNLQQFNKNFRKSGLTVHFPKAKYVSPCGRVLIESLEAGRPLTRVLHDDGISASVKHKIGSLGVRSFLKMVLVDNFVHSDLHPGNILVNFAPDDPKKLNSITFIDAGLVTELTKQDQRNFVDLFAAVATGNGRLAGELMIERQPKEQLVRCKDPEGFIQGIDDVVSTVKIESFRLDRVDIGRILERVLSLVHTYHVPIDSSFSNLVLSIIVLEGLGRQLDPELDIFRESLPILYKIDKTYTIAALQVARKTAFA